MSKYEHNFVKIRDKRMPSCVAVGMIVTYKYLNFQNIPQMFRDNWGGTKIHY